MEAMGSGVPVVASGISGIPELVRDQQTGLLTPPRDAVSLADALQRYFEDKDLRRRLGRAGRDMVVSEFDLNKNALILVQHFSKEG
jgi:glycosyltransferase involved in cell wall biosynthesis